MLNKANTAWGTKDFFSLSVEQDGDSNLPLNVLLCLVYVLCRGWLALSMMYNMNYVPLIQWSYHKLRLFSCAILQSTHSKCKLKCVADKNFDVAMMAS